MNKHLVNTTLFSFGISFILTGCFPGVAPVAINTGTYLVKSSKRDDLLPDAESGDPEAQTQLGLSYCCMGLGFSTQTATEWLCKAAKQDYAPTQYELGRIYSGKISRTPAPGQKIVRLLIAKKHWPLALMWFERAAAKGHEKAIEKVADLREELDTADLSEARNYAENWSTSPCIYSDVFPE